MNPSVQKHNLARARVLAERTQKEFAALVGCPLPTLQAVELGKLQLPEELGRRASFELDVPLEWLRANNLQTPVLTRYGEPYERAHFILAQIEKSSGEYPDARFIPGEYFEGLIAASGRIAQVCEHLSDHRPEQIDVVFIRLRGFVAELERDFAGSGGARGQNEAEDVDEGVELLQTMCEIVKKPGRPAKLAAYRQDKIEGRKDALDYLRERSSGYKAADIPQLIRQLREDKKTWFADWEKRYAEETKARQKAQLDAIRKALSENAKPAPKTALEMYQERLGQAESTTQESADSGA